MNVAAFATVASVILAALLSALGFGLRQLFNQIAKLRTAIVQIDTTLAVMNEQLKRTDRNEHDIRIMQQNMAVMASEMESHQQYHRESVLLQRDRRANPS